MLLMSSSFLSSCQNLVLFLPFSVGVLSKLYHSFPFSILFQPECYVYHSSSNRSLHPSAFILPSSYSLPSVSNRSVVVIDPYRSLCISFYWSVCMYFLSIAILVFCLSTYKVLVMFLVIFFLTECFQLCSSSLYSLFQFVPPLKVYGFIRLSKKQLCFTSSLPLPFNLRCHPRSRDEILS